MRECHYNIIALFLFSHLEADRGEVQLQQNRFSAVRAGSWVLISSICFGPHGLSVGDRFQFPVLSHRYVKEKQSYENKVKSNQQDRFLYGNTYSTCNSYKLCLTPLSHNIITLLITYVLACSPIACLHIYCSCKIQSDAIVQAIVFPFRASFLHVLFCASCFSYTFCLALPLCRRRKAISNWKT